MVPAERRLSPRQRRRAFTAVVYGFLVLYAAVSLFPVVWVLLTSFKNNLQALETPPKLLFDPTLRNYPGAVDRVFGFPQVFLNSLLVAAAGTAVIIVLAVPAAYGISRLLAVRRSRFGLAVISVRTIPGVALAIPLYLLMQGAGLIDTRTSVVAANVAFSLPFAIWMIYGFIEAVPLELEEAARLDGANRLVVLVRIVVPLVLPGIGATAILTSIVAWREFLFPLVLTSRDARTLPVVVGQFITEFGINWGELCAFAMMTILPVVLFSALVGRYLVQGFTGGGVKG